MSFASLIRDLQNGKSVGPVTRARTNWDKVITEDAVRIVYELRQRDRAESRSDGSGRFRGSLLGSCDRMQVLSYLGYAQDEDDDTGYEIMDYGTQRHYRWQEIGLSAGFLTEIEPQFHYDPWEFRGQLDGLMAPDEHLGPNGGFELKTTNDRTFSAVCKEGRPLQKHLMQVAAYCEAACLDWFSVVYESRGFTMQWKEFVVEYDDELRDMVHGQMDRLLDWKMREELPPQKEGFPKDSECAYWCSYASICADAEF